MVRKPTQSKWSTAYHEAGHAVAAFELRRRFHHVTIIPDEEAGTQGHIRFGGFGPNFAPDVDVTLRIRLRLEREIMCSLAGGIAEAIFRGRHDHRGAGRDYDQAFDCATYLTQSDEETEAYIAWLSIRTKLLLKQPSVWAGVEGLAAALIEYKHIGSRTARQIIRNSMEGE